MEVDYGREFDFDNDLDYQSELANLAIAGLLADRMEETQTTRTELARRLGVTQSRVTQLLAGYGNLTVRSIVAAALALDATLAFELVSRSPGSVSLPVGVANWPELPNAAANAGNNRTLALAA